jgi:hypothetical protein
LGLIAGDAPSPSSPAVTRVIRLRWIRESVNALLPAGSVGGDRRVRELTLGVPGFLVWQWLETHQLLRQRRIG